MSSTQKAKILIIYTGGTIGMIHNAETGALESFDFDHLLKHVPELKQLNINIDAITFDPPIDSSDMEPKLWSRIVTIIEETYDSYDGFVILHGTDTMSFTASALSFMLEDLMKPVILTGSQLPIGTLRTDGKENLITVMKVDSAARKLNTDLCLIAKNHYVIASVKLYYSSVILGSHNSICGFRLKVEYLLDVNRSA